MTIMQKLGPLMLDLTGPELTTEEREILAHPQVGGVILFSRNFVSPIQVKQLCTDIHNIREPKLLIAVDQEGGRVQRFCTNFTRLPPAAVYGTLYDENQESGLATCESAGWLMAAELLAVGVDFSFAPVLDINMGLSEVIGDRAFHNSADGVTDLARAWVRGMHQAGMAAVIKHFPGHGGVREDSHVAIPSDRRTMADLQMCDIVPFARLIDSGVEGVMPAHVYYTLIDAQNPAGFSPLWLKDILRGQLGFNGTIFSDDLSMEGASRIGSYGDKALGALAAGCDMVLVCNNRNGAVEALDVLADREIDNVSDMRFVRMHGKASGDFAQLKENRIYKDCVKIVLELGCD